MSIHLQAKSLAESADLRMAPPEATANDTGTLEENIPRCIGRLFCAIDDKKIVSPLLPELLHSHDLGHPRDTISGCFFGEGLLGFSPARWP